MINETHRFKVGQQIFHNEEVLTITQLTRINGYPAYFVADFSGKIADMDCSIVPTYNF